MRPRDTSPEAWKVYIELHRSMAPGEKLRRTLEFSDSIRQLAEAGRGSDTGSMDELRKVLKLVAAGLERVGIRYVIGGSVASSVRGVMRSTLGIDIVAHMTPSQAASLVAALGSDWYAEADQIRAAIAAGRSFNVIYKPSTHKVDVFPATKAFHFTEIARATMVQFRDAGSFPVATPEDSLLSKLRWFRDGGEVSDRQWSDIGGIIAVNPALDREYLEKWAAELGVSDLLAKALAQDVC